MALQRYEGTSFLDAGLSRRTMSLDGTVLAASGLNLSPSGTVEATIVTVTLPTKLLNNNGKMLQFFAFGGTAANGNNKQASLRLSSLTGTLLADTGAVAGNNVGWSLEAFIVRTGAATQDVYGVGEMGSTQKTLFTQLTQNSNTGLVTFVWTLTNATAAADSSLRYWRVRLVTEGGVQTAGGVLQ